MCDTNMCKSNEGGCRLRQRTRHFRVSTRLNVVRLWYLHKHHYVTAMMGSVFHLSFILAGTLLKCRLWVELQCTPGVTHIHTHGRSGLGSTWHESTVDIKASTVPPVPIPVPGMGYSRFCFWGLGIEIALLGVVVLGTSLNYTTQTNYCDVTVCAYVVVISR